MPLGGGARAPLHWSCTSRAADRERDKNSKIRARWCTRNEELYTMHAADTRGSRRCEQEVGPSFVGHTTRRHPVRSLCTHTHATGITTVVKKNDYAPPKLTTLISIAFPQKKNGLMTHPRMSLPYLSSCGGLCMYYTAYRIPHTGWWLE